ncbi:MAG: zinc-binding dehydrogenase [Clostridiales bacterium]|nr:zinc-binding dehydrogenase [Clostridiales bacterium]
MKVTGLRMYGVNDLRVETFDLRDITDDEILVKIYTDSLCMSSYKAAIQGSKHKRVPDDIDKNPVILGHEFAGVIEKVGKNWQHEWKVGERFAQQPALGVPGDPRSPGYSFPDFGGDMTYCILPKVVMENGCLIHYKGDSFFHASLGEPMSCIIGAFHAMYHTQQGVYTHKMGIVDGGSMALLACAGPMGLGAIDYAMNANPRPKRMVVADINKERLARAEKLFPKEKAAKLGVDLHFINTAEVDDPKAAMLALNEGKGYDDVLVYAPVAQVVELADSILGYDGCLNFFAGPVDTQFAAKFNFYNVHYNATHIVGTSGGNNDDLLEALEMTAKGQIDPAVMITHVGGLDCAAEATLNLPNIPGGKKLIYPGASMPLTAIDDFEKLGKEDPFFAKLHELCEKHNGLWNAEAEAYFIEEKCHNY